MSPRGIALNNPGNLDQSDDHFDGEVRPSRDRRFKTFTSMPYGVRAAGVVRLHYQRIGLNSLRERTARYAPPRENDTRAYLHFMCVSCGVAADADFPLTLPHLLLELRASFRLEQGGDFVSPADLLAGARLALGLDLAPTDPAHPGRDALIAATRDPGHAA